MSFSGDIRRFNEKVEKSANAIFRGTALNLFGKIVKRTPVLTGRLINNWRAGINSAPTETTSATSQNGTLSRQSANSATARAKLGDSIYFVNNLPYAQAIEDGHSQKAPAGMVKVTVAEFKQAVAEQAKKV